MAGVNVKSEIKPLKKVLLHRPGKELLNLTPNTLEELLFDDIPFLKVAQAEHDAFAQALRDNGVEVVYLENLMAEVLDANPALREQFLKQFIEEAGIRTDRYTPWYAAGCEWAKANGISDGTNPEAPVTREQLAAMLYRYAALKGRDLTAGENLNFTDASDVSAYALPALQWATGEKILTGSNGALNPQAPATRAHLAAILHRYFG